MLSASLIALLVALPEAPVASSSIRERKPFTLTVGLGFPELLHADVSYTFVDRITASLGVIGNLGGTGLRAAGLWHALVSSNHGHSLFVGPAMTVYPGGTVFGGNQVTLIPYAVVGWEWRAQVGFTVRVSGGAGAEVRPMFNAVAPFLSGRADVGWSF